MPNACRVCGGLGYIPKNATCLGCIRYYGNAKKRVRKKIDSRRIAEGEKKIRRWHDRHDRWTRWNPTRVL